MIENSIYRINKPFKRGVDQSNLAKVTLPEVDTVKIILNYSYFSMPLSLPFQ